MVSNEQIVDRIREFIRGSDLNTTTVASVRKQLESDFSVDLSDRKSFIRTEVNRFIDDLNEENKEEEVDDEINKVEEEDVEEEEEDSNGASKRKRGSNEVNKEVKKRGGGGFAKVCSLSLQLQEVVGESELGRTEVVKKLWAYIRENNLQDPSNRKKILCDEKLKTLFNVKSIDMFQMNKALTKHIWPLDSEAGPGKQEQKVKHQPVQKVKNGKKRREEEEEDDNDDDDEDDEEKAPRKAKKVKKQPVQKVMKQKRPRKEEEDDNDKGEEEEEALRKGKRGSSGFLKPLQLSDALVKFIGTGDSELPRSDVVKKIWVYIKENNLQDPSDKRNIICDEKLKELFKVDSFVGFSVTKLLKDHFIKPEQSDAP